MRHRRYLQILKILTNNGVGPGEFFEFMDGLRRRLEQQPEEKPVKKKPKGKKKKEK